MAGRSEYTLVGGTGVKIVPLEVSEAGTYTAGESEAYNPVTVTGGGGSGKFAELVDGSITEVTAADLAGVTTIRDYAFTRCESLSSIDLPDGIKRIGDEAFRACNLTSLVLPASVESIGNTAFGNMYGVTTAELRNLTCLAVVPPVCSSGAFGGTLINLNIYVPAESVDAYKAAAVWSERAAYIQAIPS